MLDRPVPAVLVLTVLLVAVLTGTSWAQAERQLLDGKFRAGDEIVIGTDEVVEHDVYASGGRVEVDGAVEGDLVAAAGEIVVRGTVTGNAILAGGTLRIPGTVDGTIRAAGGEVIIGGEVSEDVVTAGGRIHVADAGAVGGDFVFAGGQVINDGDVDGSVLGRAGRYSSNGIVGGSEQVAIVEDESPSPGERIGDVLRRYASLLLVAALLLLVTRGPLRRGVDRIRREPLPSLGAGLVAIVGVVVALIVAAVLVTVVAILLGVLELTTLAGLVGVTGGLTVAASAVLFAAALGFLAHVVVGLWLGHLAVGDVTSWTRAFGAAALGLAVIVLLSQIPLVGPLVRALVAILGLGALTLALWNQRRRQTTPTPQVPPPAT